VNSFVEVQVLDDSRIERSLGFYKYIDKDSIDENKAYFG